MCLETPSIYFTFSLLATLFVPNSLCHPLCVSCTTSVRTSAVYSGIVNSKSDDIFLKFILFTDSFARLLMVFRRNKDHFLLFGLKIGVVFSNHG